MLHKVGNVDYVISLFRKYDGFETTVNFYSLTLSDSLHFVNSFTYQDNQRGSLIENDNKIYYAYLQNDNTTKVIIDTFEFSGDIFFIGVSKNSQIIDLGVLLNFDVWGYKIVNNGNSLVIAADMNDNAVIIKVDVDNNTVHYLALATTYNVYNVDWMLFDVPRPCDEGYEEKSIYTLNVDIRFETSKILVHPYYFDIKASNNRLVLGNFFVIDEFDAIIQDYTIIDYTVSVRIRIYENETTIFYAYIKTANAIYFKKYTCSVEYQKVQDDPEKYKAILNIQKELILQKNLDENIEFQRFFGNREVVRCFISNKVDDKCSVLQPFCFDFQGHVIDRNTSMLVFSTDDLGVMGIGINNIMSKIMSIYVYNYDIVCLVGFPWSLAIFRYDIVEKVLKCLKFIFHQTPDYYDASWLTTRIIRLDENKFLILWKHSWYLFTFNLENCSYTLEQLGDETIIPTTIRAVTNISGMPVMLGWWGTQIMAIILKNNQILTTNISLPFGSSNNLFGDYFVQFVGQDKNGNLLFFNNTNNSLYRISLYIDNDNQDICNNFYIDFVQNLNEITPDVHKLQAYSSVLANKANIADRADLANAANSASTAGVSQLAYIANTAQSISGLTRNQIVDTFTYQTVNARKHFDDVILNNASNNFFKVSKSISGLHIIEGDEKLILFKKVVLKDGSEIVLENGAEIIIT